MNEYELYNKKRAGFEGPYFSDKMLEMGDVISFQGENYIVSELMMPENRKLRVAVWPAKINLPDDIEDLRLLRWIQLNLIGLKIRLSNDRDSIEGRVINYWPGIRYMPPANLKPGERPATLNAEDFPGRLEFLTLGPGNPAMIDLLDFSIIEILNN